MTTDDRPKDEQSDDDSSEAQDYLDGLEMDTEQKGLTDEQMERLERRDREGG